MATKKYVGEYKDYKAKQRILSESLTEVSMREFYDDIFPDEDLEREGHPEDHKPNMIIAYQVDYTDKKTGEKKVGMKNEVIFAGKAGLENAYKSKFALCSLCTFSGRRRTAKNAFKCYGFCFDLDGVGEKECQTFISAVAHKIIPCPQYIVNSGHGLHIYYLFQQPIPLYPAVRDHLKRLKHALTWRVWTNETSKIKSNPSKDMRDYLGIYQNFRMPGSCSKIGKGNARTKYLVTAYRWNTYTGARCTLSYLNEFVDPPFRVPTDPDYSSWDYDHLSLDEAQRAFPEWYEKRIVKKQPSGQWVANRGLYDWWLKEIQKRPSREPIFTRGGNVRFEEENDYNSGARDGTRYHCISMLFAYAIKCNVPYEEVLKDALSLVEPFNDLTEKPDNPFTVEDVMNASKFYKRGYARLSINAIEVKTKIRIQRRPKPKNPQPEHVARMTVLRAHFGSYENVGRPDKAQNVREWREAHPEGTKADCNRETGLDPKTIRKWWSESEAL